MSLRRYTISTRTNEVLWQPRAGETGHRLPPGWEKQYKHEELVLSPDKRFLFMPWLVPAHKMLDILEYEVYDLQSGEKQGGHS